MVTESRKMKATGLLTNDVQNGASIARSYDSLGRPTGYTLCASASPREDFSYDPIGNRISSTDYDETGASRTSAYTANALHVRRMMGLIIRLYHVPIAIKRNHE